MNQNYIYSLLVLLIFFSSGVREGLQWKKENIIFWKLSKNSWFNIVNFFVLSIAFITLQYSLIVQSLYTIMFAVYIWINRKIYDKSNLIIKNIIIDYHTFRGLEFSIPFIMFLIGGMDFFLLSAWWLIGNWIYKRVMNYTMFNSFKHRLTMTTYWMFGKPYPYSDRFYDYSLILPLLYFVGVNL